MYTHLLYNNLFYFEDENYNHGQLVGWVDGLGVEVVEVGARGSNNRGVNGIFNWGWLYCFALWLGKANL